MSKLIAFSILWRLTGNPIIALLVLLVVGYILERRYVGMSPSLLRPLKRSRRLSAVRRELDIRPYDTSAKLETARLLMEKKNYAEAASYLVEVQAVMDDSAEVLAELGACRLKLGQVEEGEALLSEALARNPKVQYGQPYLRLAEAYRQTDPQKALEYLEQFRQLHSSSCEALYRTAQLYELLGDKGRARDACKEALRMYRALPKYKRKTERRFAWLAWWKARKL